VKGKTKNRFKFQIRVPNTVLGTIWIECFKLDTLYLTPWWRGSCRLDGQKLPFFRAELLKVKGRWTLADFEDSTTRKDAPAWPRGTHTQVPIIVLGIGEAWAAENEKVIRKHQTEWLKWEVEGARKGYGASRELNINLIRKAIHDATILDRLDLLKPAQTLIQSIAGEFSQVKRYLSAQRGRTRATA
jgi:hypothetical protein